MKFQPKQTQSPSQIDSGGVERRELQRTPFECNVLLRLAEYLTFRGRLCNISADAARIVCDARYALLLHPGGVDSAPASNRSIDISIALLHSNDAEDFKASCRVKYCVAYDDQRMALGLQFATLDFRSVQYLDRFLAGQRSISL